ncbi:dTMP kinase [Candidatus Falkowbacteria bacterium CG11_big_fil_rev_8_21_14_0_20_39_10]|uniref:Thymidylate kinase n=1 Tax=Candidatus Falkowbacteria bacterium CG11_big_fil_rev_8_21_14_0_20_39_10 TaxID=1974570 RepID=A0A2M6KA21_9BACT|nr:MAG: dTMP kinase [Candidatus Falkowbacteria bacterium CG11_big_fil_rev_8_21_14_0_20_39_10]
MSFSKGKLIVIDGTDNSGKATQTDFLVEKLAYFGFPVKKIDFPQYNTKSSGLIENYLNSKYGQAEDVNPYAASCFYAVDRFDASNKIKKWLEEGKIVIADRYVTSNMAHQGGKIDNAISRKIFFNWLFDLEYTIFGLPQPDLTVVVHVEPEISEVLGWQRQAKEWRDKVRDIHEENIKYLKKVEKAYLEIANQYQDIVLINATDQSKILPKSDIHDMIWEKVVKLILK